MAVVWVIEKNAHVGELSCKVKNTLFEEHSSILKKIVNFMQMKSSLRNYYLRNDFLHLHSCGK